MGPPPEKPAREVFRVDVASHAPKSVKAAARTIQGKRFDTRAERDEAISALPHLVRAYLRPYVEIG